MESCDSHSHVPPRTGCRCTDARRYYDCPCWSYLDDDDRYYDDSPLGAVIVTLWGFLTTSPVGVAIFLTEVVVGVVSKVIEITIIRRIISSTRVVITTRILVVTIIPWGIIAVTPECVSVIISVGVLVMLTIVVVTTIIVVSTIVVLTSAIVIEVVVVNSTSVVVVVVTTVILMVIVVVTVIVALMLIVVIATIIVVSTSVVITTVIVMLLRPV